MLSLTIEIEDTFDGTNHVSHLSQRWCTRFAGRIAINNIKRAKRNAKRKTSAFALSFSNSLIIHKEKTKEITTVTVVWILDLN